MKCGRFHGRPLIEQLEGKSRYLIEQKPARWWGYQDSKGIWWIPRDGEHTDQGSIALWIQAMIGVKDDQYWGFYAHDDGCHYLSRQEWEEGADGEPDLTKKIRDVLVTRKEVDDMLNECIYTENSMFNSGCDLQRWLIYAGVRIGAWFSRRTNGCTRDMQEGQ